MEDATSKGNDMLSWTALFFQCKPYRCFKQWMLRICNPNRLKTWLRCADVLSYIISHFPIISARDHVYCSWYSLPTGALRGLPVALREFQKYLVTTILNLNECEAISIFSLFSSVVHCSGTVLILLPVVNTKYVRPALKQKLLYDRLRRKEGRN
jgi:hypothetical protein